MTAIIKRPWQPAFRREISNTLEALQELVGGYIETYTLSYGIVMIVNREGKLRRLPLNFRLGTDRLGPDSIHGTAVFVGADGEDFCSLNDDQEREVWGAMQYVV